MKSFLSSVSRLAFGLAALVLLPLVLRAQTINATSGRVGDAYSYQVTSTATGTLVYSATGLPGGLAINSSSGLITGTPTTAGTFSGTVSIASGGNTNSATINITIAASASAPVMSSGTTASAQVGVSATAYTAAATNAPTSFTFGALPAGLSANTSTGVVSGTPTAAGTSTFTVSATNASGTSAPITVTLTVSPAGGTPVITSATAPAAVAVSSALSYQITASPAATSYSASGLPVGVSLNSTTGLISGTPTVAGLYSVAVSGTNGSGTGAVTTVTFTVGSLSAITSSLAASGTVGSVFTYTVTGSNTPTSFNVGTLPAGLSANTTSGAITGTPTTAGTTSVSLSANNATGTGAVSTLVITISAAPTSGGGGGGGGSGGGGSVTPAAGAPVITAQPMAQTVAAGSSVTFSVSATGTGLNFQWGKNGTPISGAVSATYTINNVSAADAGSYNVYVSNTGGAVTSNSVALEVTTATPPVITTQPASRSAVAGTSTTFTVVASSTTAATYQWRKDGVAIAGATGASLSLAALTSANAGSYTVVVTNAAGSVTSAAATLTVTPAPAAGVAGTYLGSFSANGGSIALYVRPDRTGVFLAYASGARIALVSTDVVIDPAGRFSVALPVEPTVRPASVPATAAHEGEYHIDGVVAADGTLSGSVSTLGLSFSAPAPATSGASAPVAGFYRAGATGSSAQAFAVVSPAGEALVVTVSGATADGGRATVSASGALALTTTAGSTVAGTLSAESSTLTATVTPATGTAVTFVGANNDARTDIEKIVNVSTRSQTGTAANTLIAGFVVSGTAPKPVLVRAVGPTLSTFGVAGALSAARLEIFRGQTSLAVGNDWGTPAAGGASAAVLAATAARVGAFALPAGSRDAALLLTLEPGAYTAVVAGQGGASGVALVEVYDATEGAIPRSQRIVNIATRATAGVGENALIAGFVVTGTVPKRVLIRGVGPSLTQFGITNALARPQLSVSAGTTVLAQNAGWSTSPDAASITAGSAQAGAFALGLASADAALIVSLAPGAYTAQVTGAGGTTGVALVEVYELP